MTETADRVPGDRDFRSGSGGLFYDPASGPCHDPGGGQILTTTQAQKNNLLIYMCEYMYYGRNI